MANLEQDWGTDPVADAIAFAESHLGLPTTEDREILKGELCQEFLGLIDKIGFSDAVTGAGVVFARFIRWHNRFYEGDISVRKQEGRRISLRDILSTARQRQEDGAQRDRHPQKTDTIGKRITAIHMALLYDKGTTSLSSFLPDSKSENVGVTIVGGFEAWKRGHLLDSNPEDRPIIEGMTLRLHQRFAGVKARVFQDEVRMLSWNNPQRREMDAQGKKWQGIETVLDRAQRYSK